MAYKIGFKVTDDEKAKDEAIIESSINDADAAGSAQEQDMIPRKSVVQVLFERSNRSYSYYNDQFDLHVGDIVFVEGHMAGERGHITDVKYSFKIKLSEYKRVIAVADTAVHGQFYLAGSQLVAFDRNALPRKKAASWFKAPDSEEEYVSGSDDSISFELATLDGMKIRPEIAERGRNYFFENRVRYLTVDGTHGYAIVEGGESYEVEFEYRDGMISNLSCTCYCGYNCKHEFAAMLQLKELLSLIEKNYSEEYEKNNYFAAINKFIFFEFAINTKDKGSFTL